MLLYRGLPPRPLANAAGERRDRTGSVRRRLVRWTSAALRGVQAARPRPANQPSIVPHPALAPLSLRAHARVQMALHQSRNCCRPPAIVKFAGLAALALGALVVVWAKLIPISAWYRDGRPTRFGKLTNRLMGRYAALGIPSFRMVTLEVPGRKSGHITSTVLVVASFSGNEYLVSMLGQGADWVRNVRAAGGLAVLRHGKSRPVELEEVAVDQRAPILRAYLQLAPGGRPHFPIGPDAPVEDFEPLAPAYPVFRVTDVARPPAAT
jgi:deazaflavin-dependent oxidoreductase (nitroreductase family)